MNILIIGNGGREHALAWKITQSPRAERVFVAPGNAGTDLDGENVALSPNDFPKLIQFAKQNSVGLTIVGPEAPLAAGIVDAFEEAGLKIFGPRKTPPNWKAARSFARNFCEAPMFPRPITKCFYSPDEAVKFLKEREDAPVVVKADGLAAGKGSWFAPIARKRSKPSKKSPGKKSSAPPAIAW